MPIGRPKCLFGRPNLIFRQEKQTICDRLLSLHDNKVIAGEKNYTHIVNPRIDLGWYADFGFTPMEFNVW